MKTVFQSGEMTTKQTMSHVNNLMISGSPCCDEQPVQAAAGPERGLQVGSLSHRHLAECGVSLISVVFLKTLPADAGCGTLPAWLSGHHRPLRERKLPGPHRHDPGAAGTSDTSRWRIKTYGFVLQQAPLIVCVCARRTWCVSQLRPW